MMLHDEIRARSSCDFRRQDCRFQTEGVHCPLTTRNDAKKDGEMMLDTGCKMGDGGRLRLWLILPFRVVCVVSGKTSATGFIRFPLLPLFGFGFARLGVAREERTGCWILDVPLRGAPKMIFWFEARRQFFSALNLRKSAQSVDELRSRAVSYP